MKQSPERLFSILIYAGILLYFFCMDGGSTLPFFSFPHLPVVEPDRDVPGVPVFDDLNDKPAMLGKLLVDTVGPSVLFVQLRLHVPAPEV